MPVFPANEVPVCRYDREMQILIKSVARHERNYDAKIPERTFLTSNYTVDQNQPKHKRLYA